MPLHHDSRAQNQGSSPESLPQVMVGQQEEGREEGRGGVSSCISRHLRRTSALAGRGRSGSPVAHQFGCPPVNDSGATDIGGVYTPPVEAGVSADVFNVVMDPAVDAVSHPIAPAVNVNNKAVIESDNVLQLEETAVVLNERPPGKGKGKGKPFGDIDMDRAFLVSLPATAPCLCTVDQTNDVDAGDMLIESPLSPLSPPRNSSEAPPVPPTPTLVACKRPSKPPVVSIPCGGGESGLDVLERQFIIQMGTRKAEKKPAVCDDPPGSIGPTSILDTSSLRAELLTKVESSAPSSSTTPNFEGKIVQSRDGSASSERMLPDESAISSLTLDQSSVGDVDGDGHKESAQVQLVKDERDEDEDEQEQEQESVDGGKTHKAGKSVVGVESYFQSRHQQPQHCESADIQPHIFSCITSTGNTKSSTTILQNTSTDSVQKKGSSKSKKSAQTRGRVTAWLGKIDPDAPPPLEEIIPPSPSVARAVEWDLLDVAEEEGRAIEPHTRSRVRILSFSQLRSPPPAPARFPPSTSTPLLNSVHLQMEDEGTSSVVATPPDPRSSDFIPIEELKAQRNAFAKSIATFLGAGVLSKEATVSNNARRVMDTWAEVPQGSLSVRLVPALDTSIMRKEQEYPFNPPESMRVLSTNANDPGVQNSSKSMPEVAEPQSVVMLPSTMATVDDKQVKPTLTPSPVSYANVVSRTSHRPLGAHALKGGPSKQNGRLPVFPPPIQPHETKYDIKLTRGEGEGQAIVAVGNSAGSVHSEKNTVKPGVGVKNTKRLVTSGDPAAVREPSTRAIPASASTVASQSRWPESPIIFDSPLPPSGPESNKFQTPISSSKPIPPRTISKSKTPPPLKLLTPKLLKPPPPVPRPPLLTRDSHSFDNMKAALKPDSVQKSTLVLVPASSIPTLSSTVSPAHPLGRAGQITTATVCLSGIGRGDYKSAVVGNVESGRSYNSVKHSGTVKKTSRRDVAGEVQQSSHPGVRQEPLKSNARPNVPTTIVDASAAKPYAADLTGKGHMKHSNDATFWQGRLRNLVKKYQGDSV